MNEAAEMAYARAYGPGQEDTPLEEDPARTMALLEDTLRRYDGQLYMCARKARCDCDAVADCICDDDAYVQVIRASAQTYSGCRASLSVSLDRPWSPLVKGNVWRLFVLRDEDNAEFAVADIAPTCLVLHGSPVTYTMTERKMRDRSIVVGFDYMQTS